MKFYMVGYIFSPTGMWLFTMGLPEYRMAVAGRV